MPFTRRSAHATERRLAFSSARSPHGACGRRDVGRRRLRRGAAARARGRQRRRGPHPAALDRRAGAGCRARVLLARGGAAGARELSRARAAARHARRARGLPARRRRAVRGGLCARRDAQPLHDLQRLLPPGGARRSCGDGRSALAHVATGRLRAALASAIYGRIEASRAAPTTPADQSYMLARVLPGVPARRCVCRSARRPRPPCARRGGGRGHGRGDGAREPGRLLPRRGRSTTSSRGRAWRSPTAASATRPGTSSGATRAPSPTRRGSAAGSASRRPRRSTCCTAIPGGNEPRHGPLRRSSLARHEVLLRDVRVEAGASHVHARSSARARPPPRARARRGGARRAALLVLEEPVYGVAAGQTAVLYDEAGCVVGSGVIAPASLATPEHLFLSRICAIRQGEILKFRPTPSDERACRRHTAHRHSPGRRRQRHGRFRRTDR